MSIAKPVLRNLLQGKTKIDITLAMVAGFAVALAYKYGIQHPRRQKFQDFYDTYDPKASYERMKKAGVFKCINTAVEEGRMTLD